MIHKNFFCTLLFFLSISVSYSQELISYTKVSSLNKSDLKRAWKVNGMPEFIVNISNPIDVYEVIYSTKWHDGTKIKASGLYFLPVINTDSIPQLIYHHGTQIKIERSYDIYREKAICAGFSADGYAVIMPDYIGLGKGDKSHLYQHSNSEADAAIDMYFAVQQLNEKLNQNFIKNLTEKLLLWTGERWIISLSKNNAAKSVYEKNLEDKDNMIEEFKKSKYI